MKLSDSTKNKIITAVCYLYILLFVYASISKLLDFENFQIQLGQSPLLSAYAGIISITVILLELVISGLLTFKRTRLFGLYVSFSLMISFTIYIYLILNYSDFIPCSCGGVLENLGWIEHLVFNIVFIFMAFVAMLWSHQNSTSGLKLIKFITISICLAVASSALVIVLFFSSEHIIKRENNFIRRFIPHAIAEEKHYDLGANSYYFAGYQGGEIYLGNFSAPLAFTRIDISLTNLKTERIQLENPDYNFQSIKIKTKDGYYFVSDGTVPVIYSSKIGDKSAKLLSHGNVFYNSFEPLDSQSIAFKTFSVKEQKNILGKIDFQGNSPLKLKYDILNSKEDGVFETDGELIQDYERSELVYVHFYKNEFIVMDSELEVLRRAHTIDTIKTPQIEIKSNKKGEKRFSAPPLIVNKSAVVHSGVLINQSNLKGKFESLELWDVSVILDMYSTQEQRYLGSFFVENRGNNKMSQMMVTDKHLFVLSGNEIIRYKFAQSVIDNFKKGKAENPK